MLPLFDEHGVNIQTILSENGRDYFGWSHRHPGTSASRSSSSTSSTALRRSEDFSPTASSSVSIALSSKKRLWTNGRSTWYETVEEMQMDLDTYLATYSRRRPHQGCGMEGRTLYAVLKAEIRPKRRARKASTAKDVKTTA